VRTTYYFRGGQIRPTSTDDTLIVRDERHQAGLVYFHQEPVQVPFFRAQVIDNLDVVTVDGDKSIGSLTESKCLGTHIRLDKRPITTILTFTYSIDDSRGVVRKGDCHVLTY
jgi:hypothetical protein